jgi:hypothetical protein
MRKFRIPGESHATAMVVNATMEKRRGKRADAALDNATGGRYKSTAILPLPRR